VAAVVEAATQLLQDDENAKLSMKAIARRAGVGIGSVYEYFTDRDGIIDAIVDRLADVNFQRLKKVLDDHADATPREAFTALINETMDAYLVSPRLSRFALKTAMRFDRMDFVIKERDAFTTLIADRLCSDFPRLSREQSQASALAATEMLSGLAPGELYRREPVSYTHLTLPTTLRVHISLRSAYSY